MVATAPHDPASKLAELIDLWITIGHGDPTMSGYLIWANVLGCDIADAHQSESDEIERAYQSFYVRYRTVLRLPTLVRDAIGSMETTDQRVPLFLDGLTQVEDFLLTSGGQGFGPTQIIGRGGSRQNQPFNAKLNGGLTILHLAGVLLTKDQRYSQPLSEGQQEALFAQLGHLRNEVSGTDLPELLKRIVIGALDEVWLLVRDYHLFGIDPIRRQAEAACGTIFSAAFQAGTAEIGGGLQWLRRALSFLADLAQVASLPVALLALNAGPDVAAAGLPAPTSIEVRVEVNEPDLDIIQLMTDDQLLGRADEADHDARAQAATAVATNGEQPTTG